MTMKLSILFPLFFLPNTRTPSLEIDKESLEQSVRSDSVCVASQSMVKNFCPSCVYLND